MMEWLALGGYGGYVWGSYGVAAAAIILEREARTEWVRAMLEEAGT